MILVIRSAGICCVIVRNSDLLSKLRIILQFLWFPLVVLGQKKRPSAQVCMCSRSLPATKALFGHPQNYLDLCRNNFDHDCKTKYRFVWQSQ